MRTRRIARCMAACAAVLLSCALSAAAGTAQSSPATIRSKSDIRLWETVTDRSASLAWAWADGADSATLEFSNRVTRATWSVQVSENAGASRGSCTQPLPQTGESLVDVTLVQYDGGGEVSRESATLAYVNGAGGGPITVRANPGTREWERVREPRVFAFYPEWYGETGDSGYDFRLPVRRSLAIILR